MLSMLLRSTMSHWLSTRECLSICDSGVASQKRRRIELSDVLSCVLGQRSLLIDTLCSLFDVYYCPYHQSFEMGFML